MKLLSIQLCNFRQFYGKTTKIMFADGDRNITLIHGNNGSGKTTLLNAFTWVLYEKFTAAFASAEQLANQRALAEAKDGEAIEFWVELVFERDYKRYQVKRACRAYNREVTIDYSSTEAHLWIWAESGEWELTRQPLEEVIGRILPMSLHQYFFFDGERIESWGREAKKGEISEATKELLGIEVLDRAIRHLREAQKSLESELETIGDPQTKQLLREKEELENERDRLNEREDEIANELKIHQQFKREFNEELQKLGGSQDLQARRISVEENQRSSRQQLQETTSRIKQVIGTQSYTIFLSPAIEKFEKLIEEKREKGELPAGIKQQFVRDLLQRNECICGTHLPEGSPSYSLVEQWMHKAGSGDLEERALILFGEVSEINNKAERFWSEIDRLVADRDRHRQELSRLETELDDITTRLRSYPDLDIQKLQQRLDDTEARMSELERERGAQGQKMEDLNAQIAKKSKQISKHEMNEKKQKLAQRRIDATRDAIACISEMKMRLDTEFRQDIQQRVGEIFAEISFTPYRPQLSETYELSLVDTTTPFDHPVAASTGENQILSLSFIGAIIDRVRQWSQDRMHIGPDSSTFPIVMDSPFGSLDEIYRRQVARALPQLAQQLVILVSKTQWRGEVEEEICDRIGREYILTYNSPKPDCQTDSINRLGNTYPLVKGSPNEFEYTEIGEL
ncbi:AAA family ATPase [Roseofilum casamattae]|uniref:Nuclease SbcCD subunit C n=1 Tax=Roseofilum casamattae BLCC-M143 TaxID=3022442 RepID=A0ABT7C4A2_9CYAN|nr:AAA family ATPase [Roseofilum casamattae]MDJ1185661.1 AAA family ATPase [Roseofilum casamattae BLCC-M143]